MRMTIAVPLIEFMIVIAMIGILAAIFIPVFQKASNQESEYLARKALLKDGKIIIESSDFIGEQFTQGTVEVNGLVLTVWITDIQDKKTGLHIRKKIIPAKGKAVYSFAP